MLEIKNITKRYVTGTLTQKALNGVSVRFRSNEFVAILGPSGSGKTTLLNIVGGLDRYDEGDLIINGVSTKAYRDRDWDAYRNHSIGFVFQSYNLIPHQSILANVELALTISGVSRSERRARAKAVLERVGLGDQLHKRPNQMSGGQMQRVAIARALINNPDILLADEPTGALDSETSLQVLELLKEVAKDRLVVMVTHNQELAEQYATRIVRLKDGQIHGDTNPYEAKGKESVNNDTRPKWTSMSFFTSLVLSFNNLRTKKGRTFLTAFAGSIGIIGIALILSLSNGVNTYIEDIQRETMTSYPITLTAQSFDFSSIMGDVDHSRFRGEPDHDREAIYADNMTLEMMSMFTTSLTENNLTSFKTYLESPDNAISPNLGENGVIYSYDVPFGVYTKSVDGKWIDANENAFSTDNVTVSGAFGGLSENWMNQMSSMMQGSASPRGMRFVMETFDEIMPGPAGEVISPVVKDSYEIVHGGWPTADTDVVLVLDEDNELPTTALYALGMINTSEYDTLMDAVANGTAAELDVYQFSYEDFMGKQYYLLPASDYYVQNEDGLFEQIGDRPQDVASLLDDAIVLTITGIIRPVEDANHANIAGAVGYTSSLTTRLIDYIQQSDVVKAQEAEPERNVLNGLMFETAGRVDKVAEAKAYLAAMSDDDKAAMWQDFMSDMFSGAGQQMTGGITLPASQMASMADRFFATAPDDVFVQIYANFISSGNYDDNMSAFGFVSRDAPSSISIYADTFEAKDAISAAIETYNEGAAENEQITYTDFVGLMTSSVTTIINVITYVLIAFVAVSLVVSSIMIGIITYISVLERTKEIGILRAIGASKSNISRVFNAETFIIGTFSGILGVVLSWLIMIPGNMLIRHVLGSARVHAALPSGSALILIVLSIILTLIGGQIPARKAAKKDPVEALRSE